MEYQIPMLGQICLFPYSFAPTGWVRADGRFLSTNTYGDLYSVIGNTFGGNGTMFNVPNLMGTSPMNEGDYFICTTGVSRYDMTDYKGVMGEMMLFVDSAVPSHYFKMCDGEAMLIEDNIELYSILGTSYGGNTMYFNLPNLLNTFPMMGVSYYICTDGHYPSENYGLMESSLFVGAVHLYDKNPRSESSSGIANGQTVSIRFNQNLFRLYGFSFGGNGSTTFGLPNMNGDSPDNRMFYMVQMQGLFPSAASS